jgi:hypothetical protein
MKLVETRPFADPEAADRKIIEIANTIEPGLYEDVGHWFFSRSANRENSVRDNSSALRDRSQSAAIGHTRQPDPKTGLR